MKLLVVSDVESKFIWDHFDREAFRDVELIIGCGDLSAQYLSFLVTMLPCPLFYVPGNHDKKFSIHPPQGCVNIDGQVVNYHGIRIFGLGGCKSPRGLLHEYTDQQMWTKVRRLQRSLRRAGGIDLFVTHAPSRGVGDGKDSFHEGFDAFRYIDIHYQPKFHLYGHVHGRGTPNDRRAFMQVGATTYVNATGYKLIDYTEAHLHMPTVLPAQRMPFRL